MHVNGQGPSVARGGHQHGGGLMANVSSMRGAATAHCPWCVSTEQHATVLPYKQVYADRFNMTCFGNIKQIFEDRHFHSTPPPTVPCVWRYKSSFSFSLVLYFCPTECYGLDSFSITLFKNILLVAEKAWRCPSSLASRLGTIRGHSSYSARSPARPPSRKGTPRPP